MDPLTALGLAANIIQFVDFGCKLVSESHGLYKSADGRSAQFLDIELITSNLSRICTELQESTVANPISISAQKDVIALKGLAGSCQEAANELLVVTGRLRVTPGSNRKWQSFRQALRTVWQKEQINKLQDRLEEFRKALITQLICISSAQQSDVFKSMETLLDQNSRNHNSQLHEINLVVERLDRIVIDMGSLRNMHTTAVGRDDVDDCYQKLQKMALRGRELVAELSILNSLCFKSMTIRHSNIKEAHKKTFEWIFNPSEVDSNDRRSTITFVSWLQTSNGTYWISGKPGSGKSTLMKYLYDHPETNAALRLWARKDTLCTGSYYFWSAGTYMQKSQQGLLQSLLYDILRQFPDLVPIVCSERWKAFTSGSQTAHDWTLSELTQVFSNLLKQDNLRTKFCFFVDGLDEYEGDHFDLIEALETLMSSPNIKICISSRPWNVFEDAFGQDPNRKFYLQELSRGDIDLYVRNKLEEHNAFIMFSLEDKRAEDLIQEIVDKAQGVFLWVFLAVRDLKKGLTNDDPIELLHTRLRKMPSELEPFFKHMLEGIDDIYQEKMACTFQIALNYTGTLPLLTYSFLDEDWDFALKLDIAPLTIAELRARKRKVSRRLNSRCQGLLEVSGTRNLSLRDFSIDGRSAFEKAADKKSPHEMSDEESSGEEGQANQKRANGQTVDFLHRTVRDFLKTKDMQSMLSGFINSDFNPSSSLCRAFLAEIKTLQTVELNVQGQPGLEFDASTMRGTGVKWKTVEPLWNELFSYARLFEEEVSSADIEMLDDLDRTRRMLIANFFSDEYWSLRSPSVLDAGVNVGLKSYVEYKIDSQREQLCPVDGLRMPLLKHALDLSSTGNLAVSMEMIHLLLNHGADPNTKIAGSTVWAAFLDRVCYLWEVRAGGNLRRHLHQVIILLLRNGANPNEIIGGDTVWGRYLFTICTDQASEILNRTRLEVLQTLIHYGADPNKRYGRSTVWAEYMKMLLDKADHGTNYEFNMTRLLLTHGADPNLQFTDANNGATQRLPEMLHAKFSFEQVTELLPLLPETIKDQGSKYRYCCYIL